ncbi:hypothetical protein GCM10010988_14950 [Cnuibacter physcomitrellae]|uniref:hypothetical protein n=1 Tax=Cnuibacter physcomitrellae TaxID=1619308 RepID=UPI0012F4F592|nr:hypothetical protein [Cnuibacter physcomitrellae]MCS5495919.1 hypothetical protein [Cnuibacter physcomitrellae]GGI37634.1 hypothetical protein GCM10010988_14950 [Cnuibacter physcomitrellae]
MRKERRGNAVAALCGALMLVAGLVMMAGGVEAGLLVTLFGGTTSIVFAVAAIRMRM